MAVTKLEYETHEVVRVQRVHGGSIELHGKWAGDICQTVKEMCLVNLRSTGHHTLQVTGGLVQAAPAQRELPLEKGKGKKADQVAETILANLAPDETTMAAFTKALKGKTIMDAEFNENTGNYELVIGTGKKKERRLSLISCRIDAWSAKKKEPEPEPSKKGKSGARETTHTSADQNKPTNLEDGTIEDCLYTALVGKDNRNIDRWNHLSENTCDDKELLIHVQEIFGKKKQPNPVAVQWTNPECAYVGGPTPEFHYNFMKQEDGKFEAMRIIKGKKLLATIRDIFKIGFKG